MKSEKSKVMAAVLVVGLAGGYALRVAHADGIPDTNTLVYAGTVEDSEGKALTGAHDLKVEVYAGASGGTALCSGEVKGQTVVNGAFEVGLPQNCVAGVQANKNAHVQVTVDGKALPRSKVGAVPYAVEAGRAQEATEANHAKTADKASSADSATSATTASNATGTLGQTIVSLSTDVGNLKNSALQTKVMLLNFPGDSSYQKCSSSSGSDLLYCTNLCMYYCKADGYKAGVFEGYGSATKEVGCMCLK